MEELVTLALGNRGVVRSLRWRQASPSSEGVRVLSAEASFLVLDMLTDNPRPDHIDSNTRVAWKTGTSWGFRDAWSVGLVGPYALAVWVGNFDSESNPAFVGVSAAAPLFFEIVDSLAAADPNLPPLDLPATRRASSAWRCARSPAACPRPAARTQKEIVVRARPLTDRAVRGRIAAITVDDRERRVCNGAANTPEVYEVWPSRTCCGCSRRLGYRAAHPSAGGAGPGGEGEG